MFFVIVSEVDTTQKEWKRANVYNEAYKDYTIAVAKAAVLKISYELQGWKFENNHFLNAYVSNERDGKMLVIGVKDPLK